MDTAILTKEGELIFNFLMNWKKGAKTLDGAITILRQAFLQNGVNKELPPTSDWNDFNAVSADHIPRVCKTISIDGYELWVGHLGAIEVRIHGTDCLLSYPGSDSKNFCGEMIGVPMRFPTLKN